MKKLIAANWKMNKTVKEANSFIKEFKKLVKDYDTAEIVLCAPFTGLQAVSRELAGTKIKLGAQNMYLWDSGAYTGEVSALMLREIGCEYVILGHSERRSFFSEDDALINKKIIDALKHSLCPILCVGENLEQRKNGQTMKILESQLKNCLRDVDDEQMLKIVTAYEPVWAISRGDPNHKAANKEDAEDGHKFIRSVLSDLFEDKTVKSVRIIYGGSMKPENARELLAMPDIDGGLVGNASLDAKSFAEIVKCA